MGSDVRAYNEGIADSFLRTWRDGLAEVYHIEPLAEPITARGICDFLDNQRRQILPVYGLSPVAEALRDSAEFESSFLPRVDAKGALDAIDRHRRGFAEGITSPTLREIADRPIWVGPPGQCELRLPRRAARRFLGLHLPTRLRGRHSHNLRLQ
jgi:hypothetical protein